MNQADGIEFGDVKYREPRKQRRPDRDAARACLAYSLPQPGELAIFLDLGPADAIERHALSDTSVELGGILLGWECVDDQTGEPFVWITQSLEARHYANTQASFTYTHDSWEEITRERDRLFPDLDIVGWYHTHPDFGIFLSGHDLFIQEHFFAQPLQVAYVVDPIRQTRGFFQWREREVEPVGGFHLSAGRAERPALARFVNELENLPAGPSGAGTGLGGLSPRLEAQLIAMLNRPQAPPVSSVHASGSPLLFGLTGLAAGALGVSALLWLAGLSREIREQTEALGALQGTVAERVDEAETARLAAKEEALDNLLRSIRVGANEEPVLAAYQRVTSERDTARAELRALTTDKAALNALATKLSAERKQMETDLARAKTLVDEARGESDELIEEQRQKLADKDEMLKEQARVLSESKAGVLGRKYTAAWYTAAIALGACVMLGLGLVWAIARRAPEEEVQIRDA